MDTSTLPADIVDKIMLQTDIDKLLHGDEEFEDYHHFDPYSLTPVILFYESNFVHGVKEPKSASKPLKKASKSMFVSEVNIIGMKNDRLNGLCLTDAPYIKVEVPGVVGDNYIKTGRLKQLLNEFEVSEYPVLIDDEISIVGLLCIEKQLLLDNCEKR